MRRSLGAGVLFGVLGVVACGRPSPGPIPPLTTAHPSPSDSVYLTTDLTSRPQKVDTAGATEPTTLTDEQQRRDTALAQKIAPFVDAFANVSPRLSPDGTRVLFRSNRDGSWQAYVGDVAAPGAEPKRLTTGPERVVSATFTPDGRYVLFLRDRGGDESFRIFRVRPDGSGLTDLTPVEGIRHDPPFVPRGRPDTMVYVARSPRSPSSDVFVQGVESTDAKRVYTDPMPSAVAAVSPDGARALLVRQVSASEQVLLEIDLASGKASRVYPAEGKKVAIQDAVYTAGGKRIVVATDDGTEAAYLLAFEGADGGYAARGRHEDKSHARFARVVAAPIGDALAVAIDAGNHNEIRVFDGAALRPRVTLKMPLGTSQPDQFSEGGRSFTLSQATADSPAEVFLADATTGALKALRTDKRATLASLPPMSVTIEKVPSEAGVTVPVNVYRSKAAGRAKLPTVVLVHGGPASASRILYNPTVRWLTAEGFAVVEPNVRGSSGFGRAYEMADDREKRGNAIKDLERVNQWAKAQPWCDPERVVVFGASYGGYMTLMALTRQPGAWAAGVDLYGVADLRAFLKRTDAAIRAVFVEEFGDLEKDAPLLEQFSPLRDADRISVPLFVYQGANDPRVPRAESDAIVNALRARKVPVEYMVANDEGHSLDRRENRITFLARVTRFLQDQLHIAAR